MNIIWRIAGIALAVGLTLFLITLILKVLLIGAGLFLLARVVGPRLMGRSFGPLGQGRWQSTNIISIDNPTYHSSVSNVRYERVIPIG